MGVIAFFILAALSLLVVYLADPAIYAQSLSLASSPADGYPVPVTLFLVGILAVIALLIFFPKEMCAECPLKAQCTSSSKGRSVSIHPDEALLIELRERQQTSQGRAKLRERVAVEHALAHVVRWQGRRARYRGLRKNLFDLRRCAVVHNLHVLARSQQQAIELQNAT